jgi:hypothetical protein
LGTNPRAAHRSYAIAPAADPAEADSTEVTPATPGLGARRTYRGSDRTVTMPNVSSVRDVARGGAVVPVPVTVRVGDAVVAGSVDVAYQGGLHYEVGESRADPLRCGQDVGFCPHLDEAMESTRALLEARQIRTGLQGLGDARDDAGGVLEADHAVSEAAVDAAVGAGETGSSWAEDPTGFQAAYNEARARRQRGEPAIPYMAENATDGLGARDGGRPFGIEMEFEIDPSVNRARALQAIADDLHAEGLLRQPRQAAYHESSDYSQWRFEQDPTVHGEIITPIMYDEPESWAQLSKVCDIVRRHGGRATRRTGGHVHVGVADYDHILENHRRLLRSYHEHEDTLFRLSQNPDRGAHRPIGWCQPNAELGSFRPAANVAAFAGQNGHSRAMNFGGAASGSADSHVEFRMWDSTLDPAVIQTQVKLSLGMTQASFASRQPAGAPEPLGAHRAANAGRGRARLRGEAWEADTKGFRGMVDRMFRRDADKVQATALFAVTKWQRRG